MTIYGLDSEDSEERSESEWRRNGSGFQFMAWILNPEPHEKMPRVSGIRKSALAFPESFGREKKLSGIPKRALYM